MNEEIINILTGVKDGKKVIKYIEALEEHLSRHHHGENCGCGDEECNCGEHGGEDDWEEIKSPFNIDLSVREWEKLLKDKTVFDFEALKLVKRMRHIADTTVFSELADKFGFGAVYYSLETEKLGKKLAKALNISLARDCSFLFLKYWQSKESGEKIFALTPELYEALGNVDLSAIPLREREI